MARAKHLLLLRRISPLVVPIGPVAGTLAPLRRLLASSGDLPDLRSRISLLIANKPPSRDPLIAALAADLISAAPSDVADVLSSSSALFRSSAASLDLLSRLKSHPLVALQFFHWRRSQSQSLGPPSPEEFAKAITLAGRSRDPDLAGDLFRDARPLLSRPTPRLHNALMSAYMYNGLTKKSLAVFADLEADPRLAPTMVTYNILLSLFGRSLLIEHMEDVLLTIRHARLALDVSAYNTVIAAYITAWMWDKMEDTYERMDVRPNASTRLLLLRGYANAGMMEKMEAAYEAAKEVVPRLDPGLFYAMICAYCKSSDPDRIKKIENLTSCMPAEEEYRPWLNVLLIRVYAQEGLMEGMERFISEAFDRNTTVTSMGVMRSVISSYFRSDAVDRLAEFVRRSEDAGWKIGRSLYHCKMVMYGKQNRLEEMHGVLDEMEAFRLFRTKKTFMILYKAYLNLGRRYEVETIIGMMWKHGFGTLDFLS